MTQRVPLSDAVRAKFARALFWTLATLNQDGWPNLKPVWVELRGDRVWVNTGAGWAKHTNFVRDPRVTLGLIEPDNAYERIEIRGEVVEIVDGPVAEEHLDDLAESYLGIRPYPWRRTGERRVVLVIEPRKVIHHLDDDDPSTLPVA
jgi:PPOX class probable F420-dependent enzyme